MYVGKNVAELKSLCKDRGIKGYSKLRKAGLIEALETADKVETPKAEVAPIAPPVVKGRTVGATTMAAAAAMAEPVRVRFKTYPNTTARNVAKRRRRAIRASGGVAGW